VPFRSETDSPASAETTLPEHDAAALLLVRAVEEHDPGFFSPEVRAEAALAALDARSDTELLKRRTDYLFTRLPGAVQSWARVPFLAETFRTPVALAAFLLGALANYLGPTGVVAIVANPLAILIVWNIAVYAWLGISFSARRAGRDGRMGIPGLWPAWSRWATRARGAPPGVENITAAARTFAEACWATARPAIVARIELLLHQAAIGLLLGALAGTYVRGFFFEYHAVWQSTFMSRPESLATLLNVLLGPACLLIDGALLTPDAVRPLLQPGGSNAAVWIHRLALTGVLFVVVPRAVLASLAGRRAQRASAGVTVELAEGYYAAVIRGAREGQIRRVRHGVEATMRLELDRFADAIASYVAGQFIDGHITPTLRRFRQDGGRITDLEKAIADQEVRFEPELREKLRAEQPRLEEAIRAGIQAVVGKELASGTTLARNIPEGSLPTSPEVTDWLATGVGDTVGATVTAAVSVTTAALSGGMGKSAGVAILTGLLNTTGPVGLLIGGIAGVAIAGGAYLLGRERVTEAVKQWRLPAAVYAVALRDTKVQQVREATYRQIREEIRRSTEPAVGETTAVMLHRLSASFMARGQSVE